MSLAMQLRCTGAPDEIVPIDVEIDEPGPGHVRVRHDAIGVNFIDIYHRRGTFPLPALPAVLGLEGAGIIESVGAGVVEYRVGDRVAYLADTPGSYAETRLVHASRVVALPPEIDHRTAAAVLFRGVTAHMLVRTAYRVQAGDVVVVQAAAGGVGLLLCQWCKAIGATVIGTVGSDAKAELVRGYGCDYPVVRTREHVVDVALRVTQGRGAAAVFDGVGGAGFGSALACVQPFGVIVSFGQAAGPIPPIDVSMLGPRRSLVLSRPGVFAYTADRGRLTAAVTELFSLIKRQAVRATIGAELPLSAASSAHRALENGETSGAVILVP